MSYSQVFGGNTIYAADPTYLPLALTADVELEWPLDSSGTLDPVARIIDVTPDANGHSITMPDATLTSPGQTVLFNNLSGSYTFTVKDNAGGTLVVPATGTQWTIYLQTVTTAAGTWEAYQQGASTATVQPSALAGYGITVITNQLSQSMPVTTFSSSPRTALVSDRASVLVWTGSGAATLNLMTAVSAANNFFFSVRNAGGGNLTIDPSGVETIDGAATLVLVPGDSATVATNGLVWYTVGLGQQAVFAFDYTTIDLTGAGATYTLTGSELNRIAYEFTGVLSNDVDVVVPSTTQQYWVKNGTTGSFVLGVKTAAGTPVDVAQGAAAILYCNGTEVVAADTGGISVPILPADGGTGLTSYTVGDFIYASGATTLSRLANVAAGNVLLSGGVGVASAFGKVGLTTHVSGTLPVANGGTGLTALGTGVATWLGTPSAANFATATTGAANGNLLIGNGTNFSVAALTAGAGISVTNGAGTITIARISGLTQIGSTLTPSGSTTASFTSIPQTYSGLILEIEAASHNGGVGTQMRIEFSDNNGVNWTTAITMSAVFTGSDTVYGHITIPGYTLPAGGFSSELAAISANRGNGTVSTIYGGTWRLDAASINAMRIGFAGADYDGGTTLKLWGA